MAVASTRTLIPLDRFARVFGINPLHFNQVTVPNLAPANTCGQPMVQYGWQTAAAISREDVAIGLAEAEAIVTSQLGYSPLPYWNVDEVVRVPTPRIPELYQWAPIDVRRKWAALQTRYGYVVSGGVKGLELIEAEAAIVYSDSNSDDYFETATLTVATTVTDEAEIRLFYPGESGEDAWEIRPITVRIAGGIATITCRREQLVLKEKLEQFNARAVNGLADANFLEDADVYRVFNDPSTQVEFQWESLAYPCGCSESSCSSCMYGVQNGCMAVRNSRPGIVTAVPGDWDSESASFTSTVFSEWRSPDRVSLNYYAGYRDKGKRNPTIEMDTSWETVISRLAVTLLNRQICACQNVVAATQLWREDTAKVLSSPGQASSYRYPATLFNNPIGTTVGAMAAWQKVVRERLGEGIVDA